MFLRFRQHFANCFITSISKTILLNTRCTELGAFRVDLEHFVAVGTDGLGGTREQTRSNTFNVVSTGPAPDVQLSPNVINPKVEGFGEIFNITPGQVNITVTVTDSDCPDIPLEGAIVTLSSKTIPGSGGHAHAHNVDEKGTGKFTLGPGSEITDQSGEVKATYTAGVVGLEEDIIAKAEFQGKVKTGKTRLTIKIEGLSPLPSVPQEYKLTGETGNHLVGTNHFGTTDMIFRVFNIARIFRQFRAVTFGPTGVLKINDMSLPNGGVFDVCGNFNNLALMCAEAKDGGHFSHEIGIDVDIGTFDSNDLPIPAGDLNFLVRIAKRLGCRKIGKAHYRCDQSIQGQ